MLMNAYVYVCSRHAAKVTCAGGGRAFFSFFSFFSLLPSSTPPPDMRLNQAGGAYKFIAFQRDVDLFLKPRNSAQGQLESYLACFSFFSFFSFLCFFPSTSWLRMAKIWENAAESFATSLWFFSATQRGGWCAGNALH